MEKTLNIIEKQGLQDKDGVRLLVTAAVHGNEKCGTKAIMRLLAQMDKGEIMLKKGTVRFIPICNPAAYEKNVRFVEVNLNRIIDRHDTPKNDEEHFATQIVPHIEWCTHLFDIHSYRADDIPFVFVDGEGEKDFFVGAQTNCRHMVKNHMAMVKKAGKAENFKSVKTCGLLNNKICATLECGQHDSPHAPERAYQSLINLLTALGMIDEGREKYTQDWVSCTAEVIAYKKKPGHLVKKWANFEPVKKGDIIARYDDGEEEISPCDGVIYLPNDHEPIGAEWYYIART